MAAPLGELKAFADSVNNSADYPLNLVRQSEFPHSQRAYRSWLDSDETKVFRASKSRIVVWDLVEPQDGKWHSSL